MKCPQCPTENPEDRRFCRGCGGKLLLLCPECKAENMSGEKFCGECGYPFTDAGGDGFHQSLSPSDLYLQLPVPQDTDLPTFATFKKARPPKLSNFYPFFVRRKS
jgi:hypothetical protein